MFKKIVLAAAVCVFSLNAFAAKAVVKIGGKIDVPAGQTVGDAVVIGSDIDVAGAVDGDAVAVFGDITVRDGGRVDGGTVAVFGKIVKEAGAVLSGETFEFSLNNIIGNIGMSACVLPIAGFGAFWVFLLTVLAGFLALFLLIAALFTGRVGNVSYYIEKNAWKSFYYGVLVAVLVLPVTIFLVISIIGIPLIPILVIGLSAATLFGYTVICQLIGLRFFKALKKRGKPMILEVIVGFAILLCVVMIPFAGWLIKTIVWMVGLGATIATKFGTRKI